MKIGIDIDEVLASFISAVTLYHNSSRNTELDTANPLTPYIQDPMKYSPEETAAFLSEFYELVTKEEIAPLVGAVDALKKLEQHELIVITIRPEHFRTKTEEWLIHHFGNVFSSIHMVGDALGVGGMKTTKGDLAQELKLEVFIEDSLSNAKNISEKGIPVILIDKPWNQGDLNSLIYRVKTWEEVLEKISSLQSQF